MSSNYDVEFFDVNELDTYQLVYDIDVNSKLHQIILRKSLKKFKVDQKTKEDIKNYDQDIEIKEEYYKLLYTSIKKLIDRESNGIKQHGYSIISSHVHNAIYNIKNNKMIITIQGEYIPC